MRAVGERVRPRQTGLTGHEGAHGGHGRHSGHADGREDVRERPVAAPPALALVALDGHLQVGGVRQVLLLALQWVQVFCISGRKKN